MGSKRPKSKNKHKSQAHGEMKGTLEITRSGMGYVVIADGFGDVLVRPGNFNNSLHGDTVLIKVTKQNPLTGKREGRITAVVSRKQTEFTGTLQMATNFAFFVPDSDKPMPDFYIPFEYIKNAKNKDKVIVRMVKWDQDDKKPVGEVVSVMDAEDENDSAMKKILAENGFPLSFPDEVIEESERIPEHIAAAEIQKRKDFRDTLTFTIDPVDAKDFDDAISIKQINSQLFEIGVHIADVSHFVEPETALDEEAYKRATSVYLPDRVNPMLPERISNELCSLRPNEDKLTFSAVFKINTRAEVKEYWLGKTIIHSDHRFTYEDVQQMIEDDADGAYQEEILLLNKLAQILRNKRFENGAISFSSQEVRFKLDDKAKPIGIVVKESKEAHQLIEEFMLLANRTVAGHVAKANNKKPLPFPYRIHDTPDEQKLLPFVAFAKKFGHTFDISSPDKIAESFNEMLLTVKGKPEQHVLEQLGIRTMAKAYYNPENIGHYGLGFEHYCHFTSPIRRYPDVMVHRILDALLRDKATPDKKLSEKCRHCSEMERAAMDSERASNKYKQVEYIRSYLGHVFEAVISGVASFGFWAETVAHKCEGLVNIASLSDYDDFRLVETDYCLVGRRSGRVFRIGDKVNVRVIAANLDKRQIDYEWVLKPDTETQGEEAPAKPKRKKKK